MLLLVAVMAEEQCSKELPVIPRRDLQLGREIGAGTEKRVLLGNLAGVGEVAVMHIHGKSKQRDFALQARIARHHVLGRHPAIVRVLGVTDDNQLIVNELARHGSLTNYDGSPAALDKAGIPFTLCYHPMYT